MSIDNKQNLYSGLGYEYYTASQLWRLGYEAHKMDVDFGFDLMASNARMRCYDSADSHELFYFQVKMRRCNEFEGEKSGAGIRRIAEKEFYIKLEDFEKLLNEERSVLVCYFVDTTVVPEKVIGSFWLNSAQLNYLKKIDQDKENGEQFFIGQVNYNGVKQIYLKARIQTRANPIPLIKEDIGIIDTVIDEIYKDITNDEKLEILKKRIMYRTDKLNKWLDKSEVINLNSRTNIFLLQGEGKHMLLGSQCNFDKFNIKSDCPI